MQRALLLAVTLLAGCATSRDAPASVSTTPELSDLGIAWSMGPCRFGVALIDVPASKALRFVPEGFRVRSVAEVSMGGSDGSTLPNPREDANIGFKVFACDRGVGLENETLAPLVYASVFTGVEPPAELRRDVKNHFVKWDVLLPDAPRRDALAAAGVPAHGGNATVTTQAPFDAVTTYTATLTMDGIGDFVFQGRTAAPLPDASFTECTLTPDGPAEWNMRYRLDAGGAAPQSVTIPGDAWFNAILAQGAHDGVRSSGVVDFYDGSITLLPWP